MENILNQRQQNMVAIACLEAKGDLENLSVAIHTGLDEGLTVSEIKEALSQLYAYTGFPRSLNALEVLRQVLAEREAKGIIDKEGEDADALPEDFDALKEGTAVQTKLSGVAFDYTFVPATDYYLKVHLFGDIFARDNLTFSERELVTVSALSAIIDLSKANLEQCTIKFDFYTLIMLEGMWRISCMDASIMITPMRRSCSSSRASPSK